MTQHSPQHAPPTRAPAPKKTKDASGKEKVKAPKTNENNAEYPRLQALINHTETLNYDLLTQPWIPTTRDGKRVMIGLKEALTRPEDYGPPEGDSPEETFALLRLLESVMLAALGRPDEHAALAMISGLSDEQREQVNTYLNGRSWNLFGPNPFMQLRLDMRSDQPNNENHRAKPASILAPEANTTTNTSASRVNPIRATLNPAQAATLALSFQLTAPMGIHGCFVYSGSKPAGMNSWHVWHRGETLLMTLIPALVASTVKPGSKPLWDTEELSADEVRAEVIKRANSFCSTRRGAAKGAGKALYELLSPQDSLEALSWINRSVRLLAQTDDEGNVTVTDVLYTPDRKVVMRGLGKKDPHLLEVPRLRALEAFIKSQPKEANDEKGEDAESPETTALRIKLKEEHTRLSKTKKGQALTPEQIVALGNLSLEGNDDMISWSVNVPDTAPKFSEVAQLLHHNSAEAELQARRLEAQRGEDGPRWERVLFGLHVDKGKFKQSFEISLPYTGQLITELAGVISIHHQAISDISRRLRAAYGYKQSKGKSEGVNPSASKEEAAAHRSNHALQMLLNEAARQKGNGYGFSALPAKLDENGAFDPSDPIFDWETPVSSLSTTTHALLESPQDIRKHTLNVLRRWRAEVLSIGSEQFNRAWELTASTPALQRNVAVAHNEWRRQFQFRSAALIRPYLPHKENA